MDSNAGRASSRPRTDKLVAEWSGACSAEISVAILGGAWKPTILRQLERHGIVRFGELARLLGNPTPRVLTKQLRELEQDGLINRVVYAEVPPRVEYSLTSIGISAMTLLEHMTTWGAQYAQWHIARRSDESTS